MVLSWFHCQEDYQIINDSNMLNQFKKMTYQE